MRLALTQVGSLAVMHAAAASPPPLAWPLTLSLNFPAKYLLQTLKTFRCCPANFGIWIFFFMLFMLILSVYHCFSQLIRHPRGGQRDITTAGDDLALVRSDHGTRAIRA